MTLNEAYWNFSNAAKLSNDLEHYCIEKKLDKAYEIIYKRTEKIISVIQELNKMEGYTNE